MPPAADTGMRPHSGEESPGGLPTGCLQAETALVPCKNGGLTPGASSGLHESRSIIQFARVGFGADPTLVEGYSVSPGLDFRAVGTKRGVYGAPNRRYDRGPGAPAQYERQSHNLTSGHPAGSSSLKKRPSAPGALGAGI